jgi:hypothetical protein
MFQPVACVLIMVMEMTGAGLRKYQTGTYFSYELCFSLLQTKYRALQYHLQ